MNRDQEGTIREFLSHLKVPALAYREKGMEMVGCNAGLLSLLGTDAETALGIAREELISENGQPKFDAEYHRIGLESGFLTVVFLMPAWQGAFRKQEREKLPYLVWADGEGQITGASEGLYDRIAASEAGAQSSVVSIFDLTEDSRIRQDCQMLAEEICLSKQPDYGRMKALNWKPEGKESAMYRIDRIPLLKEDGTIQAVLLAFQRQQTGEEKERAAQKLLRESAFLREALFSAGIVLIQLEQTAPCRVHSLSEGIRRYGYEPEDFCGGTFSWLERVYEEDRSRLEKFLGRKQEKDNHRKCCYRFYKGNGDYVWVLFALQRIIYCDGRTQVVGLIEPCPMEQVGWYLELEEQSD